VHLVEKVVRSHLNVLKNKTANRIDTHFSKEKYVAYKEWLARNVGVSQYELWTCLAVMKTKKAMVFIGWTT
jgi:hypothetical protein